MRTWAPDGDNDWILHIIKNHGEVLLRVTRRGVHDASFSWEMIIYEAPERNWRVATRGYADGLRRAKQGAETAAREFFAPVATQHAMTLEEVSP